MKGCLEWKGNRDKDGYGLLKVDGKNVRAHRRAYELWHNRTLEQGEVVMHTCDNPPCFNPLHLVAGTHTENMRDMDDKGRRVNAESAVTHCPKGHPYDNVNTYVDPKGKRRCRACKIQERMKRAD